METALCITDTATINRGRRREGRKVSTDLTVFSYSETRPTVVFFRTLRGHENTPHYFRWPSNPPPLNACTNTILPADPSESKRKKKRATVTHKYKKYITRVVVSRVDCVCVCVCVCMREREVLRDNRMCKRGDHRSNFGTDCTAEAPVKVTLIIAFAARA